jgi:hypothetical protein
MPGLGVSAQVLLKGGLFERPESITDSGMQEVLGVLGAETVKRVQHRLDEVLVNPTGHYRSQIKSTATPLYVEVTDSMVVYGPWLEGTGTRNQRSSFKGYSVFRDTQQDIDAHLMRIADDQIEQMTKELET